MQTKELHQSLLVIRQVNMAAYDVFSCKYDEMSNSHNHHHYTPQFSRVLVDYFAMMDKNRIKRRHFLFYPKKQG
jgi:hypothetical protein